MVLWHVGPDSIMDNARLVKVLLCRALIKKGYLTQEEGNEICDNIIITYERKPLLSTAWKWIKGKDEKYEFIISEILDYSGKDKDAAHVLAKISASKLEEAKEEEKKEESEE